MSRMTLGEWRAFLEGVGVEGTPTEEQWRRIREKVERDIGETSAPMITINPTGPYGPIKKYGTGTGDPMPDPLNTWCATLGTSSAADLH